MLQILTVTFAVNDYDEAIQFHPRCPLPGTTTYAPPKSAALVKAMVLHFKLAKQQMPKFDDLYIGDSIANKGQIDIPDIPCLDR